MNKKLIAIDLDGTALNNDSQLSKRTIEVLKKVVENGHFVSIATGRPYRMAKDFYNQLELTTPMVNFNGGLVHIPNKNWDGERQAQIERDLVFEILAEKNNLNLDFVAAENKTQFFIDSFHLVDPQFFGSASFDEKNILTPTNLKTNPNSMLVQTQEKEKFLVADELRKIYGELLDVNPWGGPNPILEIVPKGVHKAAGVKRVAEYLEIDNKNIIAFGDEFNDREMLEAVGMGIAMKNAQPEIKAVANDITRLTNDEDGLADYIENTLELA
ncbi:MAG: Cof-type HAD-IIB family hydrolase [Lactobacillales bacterium]|nr:Cof-type HAD-IIB family hydrolase [Lactobacillales bacterium]